MCHAYYQIGLAGYDKIVLLRRQRRAQLSTEYQYDQQKLDYARRQSRQSHDLEIGREADAPRGGQIDVGGVADNKH